MLWIEATFDRNQIRATRDPRFRINTVVSEYLEQIEIATGARATILHALFQNPSYTLARKLVDV